MATISLTYVDDELQQPQVNTITRSGVEDLDDVLDFLADALRSSGYTYVERLGWVNNKGVVKWAPYL
jgi:hypothetical protein